MTTKGLSTALWARTFYEASSPLGQFQEQIRAVRNLKDNAWFEGYAPCHAPEIVVVALFEHGEHGQFAAPIVRAVIKAYFDKKARLSSEAQQNPGTLTDTLGAGGLLRLPQAVPPSAPPKAAASDRNLIYHEEVEEPEPPEAPQ